MRPTFALHRRPLASTPQSNAAAPAPSATHGKVARFNVEHSDVDDMKQFYTQAFSLKEVYRHPDSSGNAPRSRVELGDGIGLSCSVVGILTTTPNDAARSATAVEGLPAAATFGAAPGLTIAVSNLVTSARHASKLGRVGEGAAWGY